MSSPVGFLVPSAVPPRLTLRFYPCRSPLALWGGGVQVAVAGLSDDPLSVMMEQRAVARNISRHGGERAWEGDGRRGIGETGAERLGYPRVRFTRPAPGRSRCVLNLYGTILSR